MTAQSRLHRTLSSEPFAARKSERGDLEQAHGVAGEDGSWIVKPGESECSVPAYRMFLRFFAPLAATAEQRLGLAADIFSGSFASPALSYDAIGHVTPSPHHTLTIITLSASFGPSLALGNERMRRLFKLPARHDPAKMECHDKPLLHVLTGFLGSGKTTFLRRWLDFLHGRERFTGVIQNEFGPVELDAALLKDDTLVEALDDGCVCCSLADSLRPGLERIISAMPAQQFILETTGVANPGNVMDAIRKLRDLVIPGLVITVADALDLKSHEIDGIRLAQLHKADVIILNKCDLVSEEDAQVISSRLAKVNDRALLLCSKEGNIPFAMLDQWIDEHSTKKLPSRALVVSLAHGALNATHADEGFVSRQIEFSEPVSADELEKIIRAAGSGLCRAKGIVNIKGKGNCIVQYAAGQLELTQTDESATSLVLIGTALQAVEVSA